MVHAKGFKLQKSHSLIKMDKRGVKWFCDKCIDHIEPAIEGKSESKTELSCWKHYCNQQTTEYRGDDQQDGYKSVYRQCGSKQQDESDGVNVCSSQKQHRRCPNEHRDKLKHQTFAGQKTSNKANKIAEKIMQYPMASKQRKGKSQVTEMLKNGCFTHTKQQSNPPSYHRRTHNQNDEIRVFLWKCRMGIPKDGECHPDSKQKSSASLTKAKK